MADGDVVVVTGGAGFLGQHIVKMLQTKSNVAEIKVFDRTQYKNSLDYQSRVPVKSVVGDINDHAALNDAFEGANIVIHTAGIVSVCAFPDKNLMEQVNVEGTKSVIQACIDQNVQRLIYTATVDVVIGFDEIENGNENISYPETYLYNQYGRTKAIAEQQIRAANGKPLQNGSGKLLTLSLRPAVMYGEGDPIYVPTTVKAARRTGGTVPRIGSGKAKIQQAYVGNVAWLHVLAGQRLKENTKLGGQVFFACDDTPVMNTFDFMEPFLNVKGCKVSSLRIPYFLVYVILWLTELFLTILSPICKFNPDTSLRSIIYVNTSLYFNNRKAKEKLGFEAPYSWDEAKTISLEYYKNTDI